MHAPWFLASWLAVIGPSPTGEALEGASSAPAVEGADRSPPEVNGEGTGDGEPSSALRDLPDVDASADAAPEPEPEPAPAPAPAPAYMPVPPALPPPPPPPDGSGRLVGGSISVALGLGSFTVVAYEASREDGNPAFVAGTFVPLGLAALGVGTYLLIRGAKARANFLDWRAYAQQRGRPSGSGLLVGGTMSLVIGGVTLVAASVESRDPDRRGDPLATALWSIGGAGVVAGVLQLTVGLLRRNQYRAWRQRTFLTPTVMVSPGLGGAGLGVLGRF